MNRIIQASETEFLDLIRSAVREEMKAFQGVGPETFKPPATREQLADYLQIGLSKLDILTKSGELKSFKLGRETRYNWSDIEEYLQSKK